MLYCKGHIFKCCIVLTQQKYKQCMQMLKIMTFSHFCYSLSSVVAILIPNGALQVTHLGFGICCCIDGIEWKEQKKSISQIMSMQVSSSMACFFFSPLQYTHIWHVVANIIITYSLVSILVSFSLCKGPISSLQLIFLNKCSPSVCSVMSPCVLNVQRFADIA